MKKKIIVSILAAVLAMGLMACGNSTSSNESQQTDVQSTQDTKETDSADGKTLVVYYSASGNTKEVAETIAEYTKADLFELVPTDVYTSEDLDWTNSDSRVSVEHEDESKRDVSLTAETVDNWSEYDTVYIGYPIWWGIAAWPVDNFVKNNDFTGKKVIPFATASSSGLGESGELLQEMAGTGDWLEGECFRGSRTEETIKEWVDSLDLD